MRRKKYSPKKKGHLLTKLSKSVFAGGIFLLILFVIGWGISILFAYLSYHPQTLGMSHFLWRNDGEAVILLGIVEPNNTLKELTIASFDPKNGLTAVRLPSNLYFGSINVSSIYAINSLQNQSGAMQSFVNQIEEATNIPIDGYFLIKDYEAKNMSKYVDLDNLANNIPQMPIQSIIFSYPSIIHDLNDGVISNIDPKSLYNLTGYFTGQNRISILSLKGGDTMNNQAGGVALVPINFNTDISTNFIDSTLQLEHARISVYNGSGKAGQADMIASMITNQGDIIDNTGTVALQPTTYIYCMNPQNFPYTIKKFERLFHAKVISKQYSITSDISIILGKDSTEWY